VVLTGDPLWRPPVTGEGRIEVLRGNPAMPTVLDGLALAEVETVFVALPGEGSGVEVARQLRARLPAAGVFLVADDAGRPRFSSAEEPLERDRRRRLAAELLEGIDPGDRVLVLTHNDPDPDAVASAFALCAFLRHHGVGSGIGFGGTVVRPENRKMIEVLGIPMTPAEEIDWHGFHHVAMVDGQPGPNSALPPGCGADIVLDHHGATGATAPCRFRDVDDSFGSTATLVYQYLLAAEVPIDGPLATALFYGIKTDTRMRGRDVKQCDLEALLALRGRIDADALAEIEQVEYTPEIFRSLSAAAQNATITSGVLVSYLGRVSDRDTVAQAADFCTRVEGVRWVLVAGLRGDDLIFSVRTLDPRDHAGAATRRAFADLGSCGGRRPMAGGQVPVRNLVPEGRLNRGVVRDALVERFVAAVSEPSTTVAG
jgi:nanoRNase/pAp phosphatase (c-di-AMP/oligoRNAs hydrolase)